MSLWSRLANVVRGDRLIREIDEELESHVAEAIERGRNPEEARRAFGSLLRQREASRDIRRIPWRGDVPMDIRHALGQLARSPGFTAVVVITLALGIGATTAIFSVVDAVLLRPLPYPGSERFVNIFERT